MQHVLLQVIVVAIKIPKLSHQILLLALNAKKQTVTLPIITPRCEHMRIRIEGVGMAKIYSIYYETETVEGRP